MYKIELKNGQMATVDNADCELASGHNWFGDGAYVASQVGSNGDREKVYLHRLMAGLSRGDQR